MGEKGAAGDRGVDGIDGARGEPGRDGTKGADGEPGRDALQIDILPAIDEQRSYPRGTYAAHRGGVWKARAPTHGLEGWDCILRGLAAVEVEYAEDGRTTTEKHILSDGAVIVHTRTSAAMIYRGIWREGAYKRGDVTTRDGSQWHANVETSGVPGDSPDWQMCVKKGRDGKHGLPGAPGERGAEGRAGRDLTQMGPDGRKW